MPVTFLLVKRHLLSKTNNFGKQGDQIMRKSTLFISTALTIFMLAVVYGIVSAYQEIVKNDVVVEVTAEPVVQQVAVVEPVELAPALPTVISPEQATSIAVEFMGDTDVYGVEVVEFEGVPAFLVTFSSGKLIYVSSTGEIIAISEVEPVVVWAPAPKNNNNNNNRNANDGGGGDHEDHDDHEDRDDD